MAFALIFAIIIPEIICKKRNKKIAINISSHKYQKYIDNNIGKIKSVKVNNNAKILHFLFNVGNTSMGGMFCNI